MEFNKQNIQSKARVIANEEELKDRTGGEDYDGEAYVGWPSATSFGSMFHRLVEIGLANPAAMKTDHLPLASEWMNHQENRLLEAKQIEDAITSEPEWHKLSNNEQQQKREEEATTMFLPERSHIKAKERRLRR